jgi:hypothetical protein
MQKHHEIAYGADITDAMLACATDWDGGEDW